jgi:hypothetical protein
MSFTFIFIEFYYYSSFLLWYVFPLSSLVSFFFFSLFLHSRFVTLTTWHPLSVKELALTTLTSGGCSIGIVACGLRPRSFFIPSFLLPSRFFFPFISSFTDPPLTSFHASYPPFYDLLFFNPSCTYCFLLFFLSKDALKKK